ncbi:hypothetical protein HU200_047058 [Digitaria exilis]|uniref:Uncharacterized protein n=1 Tax=Digitaria exilis TaxID=1010633 RepID=A0A835EAK8_9POAL|nr:hypothetical protein HU200_047058 [Digitaria exilis]
MVPEFKGTIVQAREEEPEEQLQVAAHCIHAMDRELYRRDQEVGLLCREKEELQKKFDQLSKEKMILVQEVMTGSLRQHEMEEEMEEQHKAFKIHCDDLTRRKKKAIAARNKARLQFQTYRAVTNETIQESWVTYQARITEVAKELEEQIQELDHKSTQLQETMGYLDTMDAELIRTKEELGYHRRRPRD